jgi:hypothetical protein
VAIVGAVLIFMGVLSRLFSLAVFRRISESPTREVTPSMLPGTPWLRVQSDLDALKVIVVITYAAVLLGMALVLVGVLV